ncbi:MAG: hypothetical protein WBM09_05615 [Gallionella sp.]
MIRTTILAAKSCTAKHFMHCHDGQPMADRGAVVGNRYGKAKLGEIVSGMY